MDYQEEKQKTPLSKFKSHLEVGMRSRPYPIMMKSDSSSLERKINVREQKTIKFSYPIFHGYPVPNMLLTLGLGALIGL